jgi:outer membrane protein OmpA-like peptidoglycan-associated protein
MFDKFLTGAAAIALTLGAATVPTAMAETSDEADVSQREADRAQHENAETEYKLGNEYMSGPAAPHPVFVFDEDTEKKMQDVGVQNVTYIEFSDVSVRETVYFPFDSAQLTSEAADKVDAFADETREAGLTDIEVYGFTDTVDTDEYNRRLSENRAKTVAAHLRTEGIPAKYVGTAWYGENQAFLAKETGEGERAQANRRVIMIAD